MNRFADTAAGARQVWTVAGLLLAANDALAARFGGCVVRGELSGFTRAASGHCYFNLKDADGGAASIRCAMFRRAASLLNFSPRDGQQVEVRGRVAVYEARGELQLVVESMQQQGAGALYEAFLRLKARLESRGLFDASRKRALPPHPVRVGVITSLGAAALRDVLTTLQRRAPYLQVVVYPSAVQGAEAPSALIGALQLAAHRAEVDVIILCRGGGSLEDLWAFNDEHLVRAVAASPIPIVCGVGHETDVSLADLAADLRAPTPTAAAELVAPALDDLQAEVDALQRRAQRAVHRQVEGAALRLDHLALRVSRPAQSLARQVHGLQSLQARRERALEAMLDRSRASLGTWSARLQLAQAAMLQRRHARLEVLQSRLDALDPHRVLARGYAWVTGEDGRPIVSATGLNPGQRVQAVWADGRAVTEVVEVHLDGGGQGG